MGGGNSAAQILAEVSTVAETTWVTARPPRFLPDDVDGRVLFATARARIEALKQGREHAGVAGLGDTVMVASVKDARARGVLQALPMFTRLTGDGVAWADGTTVACDTIIWPSGTQSVSEPRLHLVGYGDWTGPASATLAGVGPSARATAATLTAHRRQQAPDLRTGGPVSHH